MSNKSKHTPGPWKTYEISQRCPLPTGCVVEVGTEKHGGAKDGTICEMVAQGDGKYEPEVTEANAQLLAAAPMMLAALQKIAEMTAEGMKMTSMPPTLYLQRIARFALREAGLSE